MRVYGRVYNEDGTWTWVEVDTDANGYNDHVYLTALAQVLKLNLGESPFYSTYGIPGFQSVQTQVPPDYYVALTQQRYAQFFASLIITKLNNQVSPASPNAPAPTYSIRVVTHQGVVLNADVAIPT